MTGNPTFGERVATARGRMSQAEMADYLEMSISTLGRIEKGKIPPAYQRKGIALLLVELPGVPRDLFSEELPGQLNFTLGEDEDSLEDSLDQIRQSIGALAVLVTAKDMPDAARALLEDELSVALKWSSNAPNSEEPGNAAQNV